MIRLKSSIPNVNETLDKFAYLWENNAAYKYMRDHPEDKCPWQFREEKEVDGQRVDDLPKLEHK